jgi:hypothetical protein
MAGCWDSSSGESGKIADLRGGLFRGENGSGSDEIQTVQGIDFWAGLNTRVLCQAYVSPQPQRLFYIYKDIYPKWHECSSNNTKVR